MLPYIHVADAKIGPVPLHPFGVLVAAAIVVGWSLGRRRARALGYDVDAFNTFAACMFAGAFVFAHVLDELFYHPLLVARRPWTLLVLPAGLSSFGGFIGAVIGGLAWSRLALGRGPFGLVVPRRRAAPRPLLPFADVSAAVLPAGWVLGRAGCALVHDHPGARTTADTLLAVAYPAPGEDVARRVLGPLEVLYGSEPRFDLGVAELLFTLVLAAVVVATWRARLPVGTYAVVVPLAYAPVRFTMDFYREADAALVGGDLRLGALTFAQWCCVALVLYAVWLARLVEAPPRAEVTGDDALDAAASELR